MHLEHFPAGRVSVLAGRAGDLNGFHHLLLVEAAHASSKTILFLDGAHVLNPYDYAEASLRRGQAADFAAERILTQRAMTPFQWHKMLTRGLEAKLRSIEAGLVVAAHFNVQYDKDDLADWEQEQLVPYALRYLRRLAKEHHVPVLVSLDLARWTRTHHALASALRRFGFPTRHVEAGPHGWVLRDAEGEVLARPAALHPTLDHFAPRPVEAVVPARR